MSLEQTRESLGLEWHLDNRLASEPPLEGVAAELVGPKLD